MTDTDKFKRAVTSRGLKYGFLAEKLGISRAALWMKINNETEFKVSEVTVLSNIMRLTRKEMDEIFFAKIVS